MSLHTSQNSIAMWKFVSVDHFRRSLRGRMPSLAKRCVAGGEQRVVRLALDGGLDRQIGGVTYVSDCPPYMPHVSITWAPDPCS